MEAGWWNRRSIDSALWLHYLSQRCMILTSLSFHAHWGSLRLQPMFAVYDFYTDVRIGTTRLDHGSDDSIDSTEWLYCTCISTTVTPNGNIRLFCRHLQLKENILHNLYFLVSVCKRKHQYEQVVFQRAWYKVVWRWRTQNNLIMHICQCPYPKYT